MRVGHNFPLHDAFGTDRIAQCPLQPPAPALSSPLSWDPSTQHLLPGWVLMLHCLGSHLYTGPQSVLNKVTVLVFSHYATLKPLQARLYLLVCREDTFIDL